MSFSFSNARLRWKLASLVGVTIVAVAALGALAGQMIYRQMVEDRTAELKSIVQGVSGIASTLAKEVAAGTLTREAALAQFGRTTQGFVYGENDYVFAYERSGMTVAHGNPKFVGTNRLDAKTAGRALVREMLDGAKATGDVVIVYSFPRPNSTEPAPKMTYAAFHEGLGVLIGTGVYIDDIEAKFAEISWTLGLTVLGVAALGMVAAMVIGNSITGPLHALEGRMRRIAGGNLDETVEEASRRDEIGAMAQAVQVFKANAEAKARLEAEQAAAAQRAEEEKRRTLQSMAERFERTVGGVIRSVSQETGTMELEAQEMTRSAERTDTLASAMAAATEQTSANVQTVAAATEELTSSIGEISRQVAEASRIAGDAVALSERANGKVTGLAEAVEKIGAVVDLIHDIASQTNLLALNATIEAARAGDAGKGFAVVASEVKQLATQTAKATEEIGQQVASIQAATGEAVGEIRDVAQVIGRVSEISTRIASAVEEQGAATNEISRNVQQAAVGTQEVAHNIAGVTAAAEESGKLAYKVLEASRQLANDAATLDGEVGSFLSTLRTG